MLEEKKKENILLKAALKEFIVLLEKGEYYKSHVALEDLWRERKMNRDAIYYLLQGYINGATTFIHFERGKEERIYNKTWYGYQKQLKYLDEIEDVELKNLFMYAKLILRELYLSLIERCSKK